MRRTVSCVCVTMVTLVCGIAMADEYNRIPDTVAAYFPKLGNIKPPTEEDLPLGTPSCPYTENLQFTMLLTGDQSFARWLHPDQSALEIVQEWKANCPPAPLQPPYDTWTTIDFPAARSALAAAVTYLEGHTDIKYWHLIARSHKLPNNLRRPLAKLDRAGMDLPFLGLSEDQRIAMRSFLIYSSFLKEFDPNSADAGLGNWTLKQFYHAPADPDTWANEKYIGLIVDAVEIGFFRNRNAETINCPDTPLEITRDNEWTTVQVGKDGAVQNILFANNKCCSRISYQCLSYGTGNCIDCGTYCCYGGVTWCPPGMQ